MTDIDRIARHCASLLIENETFKIRIEKLEAALRDLSEGWECCPVSQAMRRVARKALEGKDD
jgi:hypothetical protein